jgi:hypothetical protein
VRITNVEHEALTRAGADHSLLWLDEDGQRNTRVAGQAGGKWQRVTQGGQWRVVAGGIAFLNHACFDHANMAPARWEKDDNFGAVGGGQWQLATAERTVRKGEELTLFYSRPDEGEEDQWPCPSCPHT